MNKFSNAIRQESVTKLTENGAIAYSKLSNPVLTMFAQAGALRTRSDNEIMNMFEQAYNYDPELTVKMLFYIGDIRGGLGERRTFRLCLKKLATLNPQAVINNIHNIDYFNRWDSIYELIGTPVEKYMWHRIACQWEEDLRAKRQNKPCSLLAKWLKSTNTSSKKSRSLGFRTMHELGYQNERDYRKDLSMMRAYIDVVEKKMSVNDWDKIDYSSVPSYAMKNYRNAFMKHDREGFNNFINSVQTGEKKIKASTLFPYDLAKVYTEQKRYYGYHYIKTDPVIEEQWKALPNYLDNDDTNVIVMADVSASMWGRPIASSLGLAIYFAQRNHGDFHNQFMTFTDSPHFISIEEGQSLASIIDDVYSKDVGYSTNLERAFDYLLNTAIKYNISQKDMPKAIVVVSDSEIDRYRHYNATDFLGAMRVKYASKGYDLPRLIFFQVEARQSTFLTMSNDALFVSGQSASAFKSVVDNIDSSAWDLVVNTLMDERYKCVSVEW